MNCTFLGHRDCDFSISVELEMTIENLIKNKGVNHFFLGNHGNFDRIALHSVTTLQGKYPHITYEIVLAYIPDKQINHHALYPEGSEKIPKKFAICFRNKWMVNHSDYIVSHIRCDFGAAYHFVTLAKKLGKEVINIL